MRSERLLEDGTKKPIINVYDIEPDKLPDLMTIFILSYDPFGQNSLYYEAGSVIKTHSKISYNDGIRRIYLYVNGELPKNAGPEDKKLQNLLRYIGKSNSSNVNDDYTEKLDNIVRKTKADKEVGVKLVKSWEIEREIREEAQREAQIIIDAERKRADEAESRADEAESELKKYIEKYGKL